MTAPGASTSSDATGSRDTDRGAAISVAVAGHRTRRVPTSVAVLDPFVRAGIFAEAEIQLTANVARLAPGTSDDVLLALALAARGPRLGHVCVLLEEVAATLVPEETDLVESSELPWPDPARWGSALLEATDVVASPQEAWSAPLRPLVWDGARLYLQRYWTHELAVTESLMARAGRPTDIDRSALDAVLGEHFGTKDDPQRRAVDLALSSGFSVISGGPGTGKTTTVAKLIAVALQLARETGQESLRIAMAAPTGKAAARMTEAIGSALGAPREDSRDADTFAAHPASTALLPAVTLHRLLGSIPGRGFGHHAANPLDADLVVIDETSMVDLSLMAHLLDALRPDTALVLVGDPDQLASVEAGTVLGDIVGAASQPGSPIAAHVTELTRIYRFGERSNIAAVAGAIRRGDAEAAMQVLLSPVERGRPHAPPEPDAPRQLVLSGLDGSTETESDASTTDEDPTDADTVAWVPVDDEAAVAAVAERLVDAGVQMVVAARDGDSPLALESASTAKLIAATRRGPFGLYAWTDRIEAGVAGRLTDELGSLRRGERWYIGKPVLITANDPILELANGDVGVVIENCPERGSGEPGDAVSRAGPASTTQLVERVVAVRAGGTVRHIPPARLERVEPWWAMTIHKSQGSEFPEVVVALPEAGSPILTRELLYTAITRARRSVTVIGSEEAVRAAVERPVSRASGLLARLGASES